MLALQGLGKSYIKDVNKMVNEKLQTTLSTPSRLDQLESSEAVQSVPPIQHMPMGRMDAIKGDGDSTGLVLPSYALLDGSSVLNFDKLGSFQEHDQCGDLVIQSIQQRSELQLEHSQQASEGQLAAEVSRIVVCLLENLTKNGLNVNGPLQPCNAREISPVVSTNSGLLAVQANHHHESFPEQCSPRESETIMEPVEMLEPIPTFEDVEEPGSESDEDGLKHLWQDMAFSLACTDVQEHGKNAVESNPKNGNGCDHNFFVKDDVGLVCDLCGLVEKDIETIFQFTWGIAHRRKLMKRHVLEQEACKILDEDVNDVAHQQLSKQYFQSLTLHPRYKEIMHEHQLDGFHFLERNIVGDEAGGCILAHAPGTGKSFLIIAFLQSFLQAFPEERVMIIAPKGMLFPWVKEFRKWKVEEILVINLYDAKTSVNHSADDDCFGNLDGISGWSHRWNQLQKIKEWKMNKSILLLGYAQFSSLVKDKTESALSLETKKLLLEVPGLLILDEGHLPRNKDTKILDNLTHIHTKRRILLSGTIFQNNFEELFNSFKLIRPDFLTSRPSCVKSLLEPLVKGDAGASFPHDNISTTKSLSKAQSRDALEYKIFVENLGGKIQFGSKDEQIYAVKLLRKLTKSFVHWYKGQVLETLPGLTDFTVFLHLTQSQKEVISSIQNLVTNHMKREIKSVLACIHPSLAKFETDSQHDDDPLPNLNCDEDPNHGVKTKFVLDVVALSGHLNEKVLVFSQFKAPLLLLIKMFERLWDWSENRQMLRIDGDISAEDREKRINQFNNDAKARILLASIRACGEGVCLIGASRVILLDMPWNPAISRQAISRAFRIGQTKRVFVYRLVGAGSLEEDIHRTTLKKEWLAKVIFESCEDEEFDIKPYEVAAELEDRLFESPRLRKMVKLCYQSSFL